MSSACLNAHDLFQYESPLFESWFVGDVRGLGQAFCPTLALVNHSCDPNSIHFNVAQASVSVAVRNIFEGEEVPCCSPIFAYVVGIRRRRTKNCQYNTILLLVGTMLLPHFHIRLRLVPHGKECHKRGWVKVPFGHWRDDAIY